MGVAQIFVHGGVVARDGRYFFIAFFHGLWLFLGKKQNCMWECWKQRKIIGSLENSKWTIRKKEKVSGFSQPLFRANLTADRICLADLLCCAIGVQQQAANFVGTSIFLYALTIWWSKVIIFIIRHSDNFSLLNLVIENICYELLLTVYLTVLRSVRIRTIHVSSPEEGLIKSRNLLSLFPIVHFEFSRSIERSKIMVLSVFEITKKTVYWKFWSYQI
jgi:hypothetical protein